MNRKDNTQYNLKENLKALRNLLPTGYIKILAEEFGVTAMTVSNALQFKTRRFDIIEGAIRLAEKNREIAIKLDEVVHIK